QNQLLDESNQQVRFKFKRVLRGFLNSSFSKMEQRFERENFFIRLKTALIAPIWPKRRLSAMGPKPLWPMHKLSWSVRASFLKKGMFRPLLLTVRRQRQNQRRHN